MNCVGNAHIYRCDSHWLHAFVAVAVGTRYCSNGISWNALSTGEGSSCKRTWDLLASHFVLNAFNGNFGTNTLWNWLGYWDTLKVTNNSL